MSWFARAGVALCALAAVPGAAMGADEDQSFDGSRLFVTSAVESPGETVKLPLYRGTGGGDAVYYVILDTSDGKLSDRLGVNRADKLRNALGTAAVPAASGPVDALAFGASVDFALEGEVQAPNGALLPVGAQGDAGYSPLARIKGGAVVNAPHVARDADGDGRLQADELADKVVAIDLARRTVTLRETKGFQGGRPVRYVSTDASFPLAAALEEATLAPALAAAPRPGDDSSLSSRAALAAFVNGQTGVDNPQRQGIGSALTDGLDPLNVLSWAPNQGRYSPLWDVHLTEWTPAAVAAGRNLRQTDWGKILGLADDGVVTGPGGARFGPAPLSPDGVVVNCPIISRAD